MPFPISRREMIQTAAVGSLALYAVSQSEGGLRPKPDGWVKGDMTGAAALVEALLAEGTDCVFGIPGAQDNELWDTMKSKRLPYLLVTHEYSATAMADGYARSTGKVGVACIVPGPGVTNALTGIGEALLDSVPMVNIVCEVATGEKYRAFQVHAMNQVGLLQQVTKAVYLVQKVGDIPDMVRQAFCLARSGEPGPVAVVVPYNFFATMGKFNSGPLGCPGVAFDEEACRRALQCLSNRKCRVGIYAGLGCMDYSGQLTQAAELLQAPVATSVSGKGAISENHPLAVGWGYGPQGTATAETVFKDVDVVLAIGVKFSEVSTGFYSIPKTPHLIQVDINPNNLGKVVKPDICVTSDAGVFLDRVIQSGDTLRRGEDCKLAAKIKTLRCEDSKRHCTSYKTCGVDPMHLILALRRCLNPDALLFADVTMSEHYAAEAYQVTSPRTYFNPADNQSMGWSIPAALGAQRGNPGRQVVTLTGDGCFLMSAMEISTAARESLPVKFFILDDHAYHYMQQLQLRAYHRTTATQLAMLDYSALAKGFGVAYQEITPTCDLDASIRASLAHDGPVLVRVAIDYGKRPCRWIEAARDRFVDELSLQQKVRFAGRIGGRTLTHENRND